MVNNGKEIRLSKIINPTDGKSVIIAADHGFMLGAIPGVIDLQLTLKKVIEGRPDAILLSPVQAVKLNSLFWGKDAPALLIRADWTNAFRDKTYVLPARKIKRVAVTSAKQALSIGASGIVTYYFLGSSDDQMETYNFKLMTSFAKECEKYGLPYIVESLPFGERVTGANYADLLTIGMRIAAEAGADAIKTAYTGDVETFKRAIDSAGIPVLALGGAKAHTMRDALEIVEETLLSHGAGVVFGRQVIQAEDPAGFVSSIRKMVHEKKSIDEILNPVKGPIRILVRAKNCIGCLQCQLICSFSHNNEFNVKKGRLRVDIELPDKFIPFPCTLCGKCVDICPTKALVFEPSLHYIKFLENKCIHCKKCVPVCPFNIVGWNDIDEIPFICDMCKGSPKCVRYCPTDALLIEPIKR
jgi:DhnA family fructose-bisphosphate aldolase class Ia/Fe-S-cluster-containing hydrogenase component 2